ncbi:MAG: right-handed parallel beta-helix repeat-containing protein [Candidatus Bathyarchaeota archaeon]|nr:right-handed parallel beta-helix repeat-containing protein [Candidatus Bathyarchaeum sp.]
MIVKVNKILTSFFHALLIAIVICSFIQTTFPIVFVQSGLVIVIDSDTTWTMANSPFNITGPLLVSNGVSLTIEPGVTVNFMDYDYYMQINGTLIAKGESGNPIYFNNGNEIQFTKESAGWNEQTNTGSILEKAILTNISVRTYGSPKINNNTIVGSIRIEGSALSITNNQIKGSVSVKNGSPKITNNIIDTNPGTDWVGRPNYSQYGINIEGENTAYIANNDITSPFTGAAIKISDGTPTIERNFVTNTYGYGHEGYPQSGIQISSDAKPLIQNNTITKSSIGITCYSSFGTIIYNNIFNNTNYNIYTESNVANEVNAPYNWWGTTDTQAINATIYDYKYDFNIAKLNFTPILTEENPKAQPEYTTPIPEFPSWTILPLAAVIILVAIIFKKKIP